MICSSTFKTSFIALGLFTALTFSSVATASSETTYSEETAPLTIEDVLGNAQALQKEILESKRMEAAVLVSLSMPQASLKKLAADTKDAGIPMVFRGVPVDSKNSNKPLLNPQSLQPFNFLTELGAAVEINPEIFRDFGVTEVPALVIREHKTKDPSAVGNEASGACSGVNAQGNDETNAIVLGDVTLGYMLDTLIEREDAIGEEARRLRSLLGNRI